jgi:putative restriction endonuclease
MARALSKPELLRRLIAAVDDARAHAIVTRSTHPFLLRVYRDGDEPLNVCIYIWNVTHGGGAARPAHEYRIQLTGAVPSARADEKTFLLGWHEDWNVFVAFDIRRHDGQASASPSIQVPLDALRGAHAHSFSSHVRGNGETVIAFRTEFLFDYLISAESLHGVVATSAAARAVLNRIDAVDDAQIESAADGARRVVLGSIRRRFREHDFRTRVLSAYGNRCAMCGIQLRLIEAAHILPVAADGSTDITANGVALCANHHKAYDANLVSFDELYQVQVSDSKVSELSSVDLTKQLASFRRALLPALSLPADRRDYPPRDLIAKSRQIRRWVG